MRRLEATKLNRDVEYAVLADVFSGGFISPLCLSTIHNYRSL
jgi:hypothetical protein